MASAQHILSLTMSCVGTMNTDPGVVASDGKLQAVLALERRIGVSGYGHNNGGGYLAWLLTTYLWPNMDTEGSYHLTLVTTSCDEEYEGGTRFVSNYLGSTRPRGLETLSSEY